MLAANQLMGFEAFGRGCYKLQLASLCRELVQGQLVMIVELSRHVRYVSSMSYVYIYIYIILAFSSPTFSSDKRHSWKRNVSDLAVGQTEALQTRQ